MGGAGWILHRLGMPTKLIAELQFQPELPQHPESTR
jgi:hypothetical protein